MKKIKNAQINVAVEKEKKKEFERIARLKSIEEDKSITVMSLIREYIDRIVEISGSLVGKVK